MVLKALLKASCLLKPVKRQGIGEGKAASSPITARDTHLEGLFELWPPAPVPSPPLPPFHWAIHPCIREEVEGDNAPQVHFSLVTGDPFRAE